MLGNNELDNERPVAFLLSVAYPEIWGAFVERCQHESQFNELDPRLVSSLVFTPSEIKCYGDRRENNR
jgi:hypothetical protein